MDELVKEEEICKQLLELAQTPEQVRYLTTSNQSVLLNKVQQYKAEAERDYRTAVELAKINKAKEDAYLKAIVELAKGVYYTLNLLPAPCFTYVCCTVVLKHRLNAVLISHSQSTYFLLIERLPLGMLLP
jgi:hypothetical protein